VAAASAARIDGGAALYSGSRIAGWRRAFFNVAARLALLQTGKPAATGINSSGDMKRPSWRFRQYSQRHGAIIRDAGSVRAVSLPARGGGGWRQRPLGINLRRVTATPTVKTAVNPWLRNDAYQKHYAQWRLVTLRNRGVKW